MVSEWVITLTSLPIYCTSKFKFVTFLLNLPLLYNKKHWLSILGINENFLQESLHHGLIPCFGPLFQAVVIILGAHSRTINCVNKTRRTGGHGHWIIQIIYNYSWQPARLPAPCRPFIQWHAPFSDPTHLSIKCERSGKSSNCNNKSSGNEDIAGPAIKLLKVCHK